LFFCTKKNLATLDPGRAREAKADKNFFFSPPRKRDKAVETKMTMEQSDKEK
jgi:hypothetical protein